MSQSPNTLSFTPRRTTLPPCPRQTLRVAHVFPSRAFRTKFACFSLIHLPNLCSFSFFSKFAVLGTGMFTNRNLIRWHSFWRRRIEYIRGQMMGRDWQLMERDWQLMGQTESWCGETGSWWGKTGSWSDKRIVAGTAIETGSWWVETGISWVETGSWWGETETLKIIK